MGTEVLQSFSVKHTNIYFQIPTSSLSKQDISVNMINHQTKGVKSTMLTNYGNVKICFRRILSNNHKLSVFDILLVFPKRYKYDKPSVNLRETRTEVRLTAHNLRISCGLL